MSWSSLALARNGSEDPPPVPSDLRSRTRCRAVEVRTVWKGIMLDARLVGRSFLVDDHTLFRIVDGDCVIDLARSMTLRMGAGDGGYPGDGVTRMCRMPLIEGIEAQITHGPVAFVVAPTADVPTLRLRGFAFRWAEQKYLLGSALGLALMLWMLMSIPRDAGLFAVETVHRPLRILPVVYVPPLPPLPPISRRVDVTAPKQGSAVRVRPPTRKGKPIGLPQMGLLGLLDPKANSTMAQLLGRETALGLSGDEALRGLSAGDGDPFAGFIQGTGMQGGGARSAMIGTGQVATLGLEAVPQHAGDLPPRLPPRAPPIVSGAVETRGGLDKDIVRRIVRRHLNEIRFCYDQALVRNHSLAGRLVAEFTIAADGRVAASVVSTGIGDPAMDGCVVLAIRRWEFPRPGGGGLVMARYPFTFSAP